MLNLLNQVEVEISMVALKAKQIFIIYLMEPILPKTLKQNFMDLQLSKTTS